MSQFNAYLELSLEADRHRRALFMHDMAQAFVGGEQLTNAMKVLMQDSDDE